VLACGSLGLIGLSRFLQCFVSFFCSHPFSAIVVLLPLQNIFQLRKNFDCQFKIIL
jgi:hypothetical protein